MRDRSAIVRMAKWSALHPGRAIIGWFVFVVLSLGIGIAVGTHSATTEDYRVGEAGRAEAIATEGGLQRKPAEQVVISARTGPLDVAAAEAAAAEVTDRMTGLAEVEAVAAPVRSADGRMVMVEVTMKGPELAGRKHVDPLLEQTAAVQANHPDLLVEQTGSPSISKAVDQQRSSDLALSEAITLPVTLLTLLLVFGSVVTAGLPVLLALSSIAAAMGLAMVASHVLPDAGVGNNVILLIGMAVGVDYTLFYLKRYREERARAGGRLSAEALVELAATTSGRAIVVSGLAVVVSSATLYLAADVIFASLATGTIIVVLIAVASSLTALPALLVKIGRRAERRQARRDARAAQRGASATPKRAAKASGSVWQALLRPASNHPVLTLVVSVLVMLGLAAPVLGLNMSVLGKDSFSRDIPAMQTYDRLHASFPELQVRHQVVVRAESANAERVTAALRDLGQRATADPLFAKNTAPVLRTSADGRISLLELAVPFRASSPEALLSLAHIREDYLPATVGALSDVEYGVTGDVPRDKDYLDHQNEKLPLVVGFLLLLTFVMTVLAFRSVVIGLVGVVLNLLSAAASLGLLALVFQYGWGADLFGANAVGSIGSRVPLFLFVILFGLSMDYQVFVVSRIREAALRGVPTRRAVLDGIGTSASVVTSAAIVMVTVFASFVFLHLEEMKQIGFSLAVAVLLDAFIIRIMILPSILTLLGRASWWPSRAMRRAQSQPTAGADTGAGTEAGTGAGTGAQAGALTVPLGRIR
ncbi:MMPL family transporter [Goodfellowiella coeruleoviolacea]|uniref:Drug exporter of the RND superfamily n=1 Tax=Goodfellowiella coeruleoviolacea TaxID=334858 RepID=A0AAE3GJA3_9PSEU|nr:MMPL family transporter [Goodfellowiella coeruleoviolacea]MCP2169261.1 putative drug exporter of the RND superfamily [Goodfellowiella coeruleoviolacea]